MSGREAKKDKNTAKKAYFVLLKSDIISSQYREAGLHMELLQKLTLYDLLGYTLPGSMLLAIYKSENMKEILDISIFGGILFIGCGFLTGIMISEVMQWIENMFGKRYGKKQWDKVYKIYALTHERIFKALKNAQIISEEQTDSQTVGRAQQYYRAMYTDIQSDSRYSRIHNYTSAAVMYRNMIFVSIFCIMMGIVAKNWEKIIVGLAAMICFGSRWKRFDIKKKGYTVCWFIEKRKG